MTCFITDIIQNQHGCNRIYIIINIYTKCHTQILNSSESAFLRFAANTESSVLAFSRAEQSLSHVTFLWSGVVFTSSHLSNSLIHIPSTLLPSHSIILIAAGEKSSSYPNDFQWLAASSITLMVLPLYWRHCSCLMVGLVAREREEEEEGEEKGRGKGELNRKLCPGMIVDLLPSCGCRTPGTVGCM